MATKRTKRRPREISARAPSPTAGAKPFRGVLTRINDEGLRALRLLAVERDTRLQTLMIEAINDLLRKYRRPAVASNPLTQFSENSD
jgi:antitoxin-like ribbon-helix-helix protein